MWSLRVLALIVLLGPAAAAERPGGESPPGLDRRIPWNDSRVVGSPDPLSPYKVVRAFPKLTVKQPLGLFPEPGTNRLFLLCHAANWAGPGQVLVLDDNQDASKTELLLEVDGLAVGLTFHPKYEQNGYIFIGLNGPVRGWKKTSQAVRYTVDRKTGKVDPKSKKLIIEWPSNGHNGDDLDFGNDGYLYVSAGDGSSDSDADLTGQTLNDLTGSVIRIDVDHPENGKAYGIPKDNPFVDRPGARGELWAYGLRNPWKLSYDHPSGQLWVGNNGQDLWEQVFLIQKGGNYGWSVTEGSHIFHALRKPGPDPILLPAAEHSHSEARSLTGGRVYRGTRLPDLVGTYVYGDWSTGRVWGVKSDDGKTVHGHRELVDTPFNITGFGTDHANELYVIDHAGAFYRLEPTTEADRPTQPFPTKLSETGLFASVPEHKPHPAALPFDVITPQWADGATMERFAAIPGSEKIIQKAQLNAGGTWTFPNGSVMIQTLSLNLVDDAGKAAPKRVETRLMTRQQGEWVGYSYKWNPENTDAELVSGGGIAEEYEVADANAPGGRREQVWRFASRSECMGCHSRAAGFVLGFTQLQLDRDHDYAGRLDNQVRALEHIGLFEGALPKKSEDSPKLVNPYTSDAPLEARVKSYLSVNCSVCHVGEGGGNAKMQLDLRTPLRRMRVVDEVPIHNKFDLPDARIVAPGAPERSVLYYRISNTGTGRMPPLVTTEVDRQAIKLIGDWIRSLPATSK